MFDVSWSDPTRETIAQRKNRKEQDARNGLSRESSIRSRSRSSRSSESVSSHVPARPTFLGFLGGNKKDKKVVVDKSGTQSTLSVFRNETPSRRVSSYTVSSEISTAETIGTTRIPENGFFTGPPYISNINQSRSLSDVSESVFSGYTGRSVATESSWTSAAESRTINSNKDHGIQPLGPTSSVTQCTEIAVSPRGSVKAAERVATVVHMSAPRTIPVQLDGSSTETLLQPTKFNFPISNFNTPEILASGLKNHVPLPPLTWPVAIRSRSDSLESPPPFKHTIETRKPRKPSVPRLLELPFRPTKSRRQESPLMEATHLQRNIRRMEAASSKIILERLKEEWLEVADASVYRELELEKQLWMLSALWDFNKTMSDDQKNVNFSPARITKVLSLFENHASASFLSALTTATEVHHLSPNPLSPKCYPNIRPLLLPTLTSYLPYASNTFSSIHTFSLPTLLPASSIPEILRECHRTLISASPTPDTCTPTSSPDSASESASASPSNSIRAALQNQNELPASESPFISPSLLSTQTTLITTLPTPTPIKAGTLHLTLIDPCPHPSTLGPKLRAWLDTHLLLNLEKQFQCINPSRLFPGWLAESGLRAEGSTILTVLFLACVDTKAVMKLIDDDEVGGGNREGESERNESAGKEGMGGRRDDVVRQELKSVVGRMLWKEMWGSFVEGERWWWDDGEVVEECEHLGTMWEYCVIEGVKEG